MVADQIRVPDLTDADQATLNELVAQWREKRPRNNLRSGFYDPNGYDLADLGLPELERSNRLRS